jgi:hypothetical protein
MGQDGSNPRRRRLVAALVMAGVLAALPAGAALAGGSGDSGSSGAGDASSGAGAVEVQSTAPDGQQPDRRDGKRDCPEDRERGQQESVQL